MEVDETQANDISQHKGERYYFCSPGCRSEFDRNPERYTGGSMDTTGASTGSSPQGMGQHGHRSPEHGRQQAGGRTEEFEQGRKRRKAS